MSSRAAKSRSSHPTVIVEIGEDWVKLAAVEPSRQGLTVSRLHLESFESIGPAVSETIASVVQEFKLSRLPVIGSLPRQMVNVRILELPSVDAEEIEDMVDLQIGKQTPYSKDEIVSDYRVIGSVRQGYTRVMLAIVQRNVLRERFCLLEEAGLNVERMSVSTEGVLNWYLAAANRLGGGGTVVVLDVDSFYSDFLVVSEGALCFTRSILVGANHLASGYARWKDKLAQEVQSSLEIFAGEMPELQPEKIVLSGAGQRTAGLADDLAAALGMTVVGANCLEEVKKLPDSPTLTDPQFVPASMTPIVGMGLDPGALEFALIPDSVRMKNNLARKAKGLTLLAMLLMAAMVASSIVATFKVSVKQRRCDLLNAEILGKEAVVAEVQRMRDVTHVVRRRQDTVLSPLALLEELRRNLPEDIFFEGLDIDVSSEKPEQHRISLKCVAETPTGSGKLVGLLEQSMLLKDARASDTSMDRQRRYRFTVQCALEHAE